MTSTSYSTPRYGNLQSSDTQLIQRLIQSITVNIQKIAQNGNWLALYFVFVFKLKSPKNPISFKVSQIENMNMQIGTLKDSESLRDRL